MDKMTLTDVTRRTAGGYRVDRKCKHNTSIGYCEVGNTLTYTLVGDPTDINSAVAEIMIMAAQDVLDLSKPTFKGDLTAKELAGKVSDVYPTVFLFTEEHYVSYQRIYIECGTYRCHYDAKEAFLMLSEWEGMMGVTQKKAHRFACDGEKELDKKDKDFKPYKCCRGYRESRSSIYDADEQRIARKYRTLGPLSQSLTDEGMRKAMSALTAIVSIGKLYGDRQQELAQRAISQWLWDDYKREGSEQAVMFDAGTFDYAPDCWRVVDEDFAKEMLMRWKKFMVDNAVPDWIKKDGMVQFRNQENTVKKWQGKLKVCQVYGKLDYKCSRIEWWAEVCTTKGKWDSVHHNVSRFEAYGDNGNDNGNVNLNDNENDNVNPNVNSSRVQESQQPTANSQSAAQPSFAELLRRVLLAA